MALHAPAGPTRPTAGETLVSNLMRGRPRILRKPDPRPLLVLLAAASVALAGCGKPQAWGEENSVIVLAPDSLWAEVQDTTYAVLEPTLYTTRPEKMFVLTQAAPGNDEYEDLRVFKLVLVMGPPNFAPLRQAIEAADLEEPARVPSVFQVRDVWARDQVVTVVVLDPERPAESWRGQLPAVLAMLDSSFRATVRNKMFVTGPDTALARSMTERFGFSLLVPRVYDHVVRGTDGDSLVIFRNDNPDPSQLIRSVLVDWRPRLDSLDARAAYEWRAGIDSVHYNVAQDIDTTRAQVALIEVNGNEALEVTGVWQDVGGAVPAAGPFIVRAVQCPERTYFLDAWLFAPGQPKYEYVLQLREILGSFRCEGVARPVADS